MTAIPGTVDRTRARTAGVVIGLASAVSFASSGPVMKPLLEAGWSIGAALLLRMGGAAVLLSPWLIRAIVRDRSILRRHGLLVLAFGLTGVAGCQLFYFSAMQRMPVAIALLVQYTAPVMLVAWVWLRTRRRPSAVVLGGTALAIVGLVLVVDVTGAAFDPLGIALALGAAVWMAAYFVIADRTTDTMPPLVLAGGGLVVGAALMVVLCATGVLPFVAPAVSTDLLGTAVPWFLSVSWVALVATALGYGLGVLAVPRIGARLASFVGLTEVLFAMLFGWLLLGEAPTPVQGAGGALILAGVVLVRADPAAAPKGAAASVPAVPAP
ncbi:EamA family transporter [Microbacterium lushaniae]|uniref:EamA family transporter n=1 Tax=Microbacterium lushaniae TaxID=2614639 RepID=A0A5J6L381_9MICO|nr:DMT family transporter [Microbacterium lushaniae]QEW02984.1 EamA family transporter [Microbacterium lushaniae]